MAKRIIIEEWVEGLGYQQPVPEGYGMYRQVAVLTAPSDEMVERAAAAMVPPHFWQALSSQTQKEMRAQARAALTAALFPPTDAKSSVGDPEEVES